jgi:hypothetical protein
LLVAITLPKERLDLVLDDAVAVARSEEPLPRLWVQRVERLGSLGIRTYIAALGAALLAKATDPRVDSLAQDRSAGPRGYSLRVVAEFLAERNGGRFHMGAQGRNPLNNRPFLGGPSRIDEFTKIDGHARPSYELFRDCLVDLNRMSAEEARLALAAWLRVRTGVKEAEREASRQTLQLTTGLSAQELVDAVERFVRENPEGGRRGQAFVAAALDCVFTEVVLQSINDPTPGDVRVLRDGLLTCVVEVKQVAVDENVAVELADNAKSLGASLALLVVMADNHEPLDREQLKRRALADAGVLVAVVESARELLGAVAVFSGTPVEQIVSRLPGRYASRMREHEVSEHAQRRWAEIIESRSG